jgi:hypothetical protein
MDHLITGCAGCVLDARRDERGLRKFALLRCPKCEEYLTRDVLDACIVVGARHIVGVTEVLDLYLEIEHQRHVFVDAREDEH